MERTLKEEVSTRVYEEETDGYIREVVETVSIRYEEKRRNKIGFNGEVSMVQKDREGIIRPLKTSKAR